MTSDRDLLGIAAVYRRLARRRQLVELDDGSLVTLVGVSGSSRVRVRFWSAVHGGGHDLTIRARRVIAIVGDCPDGGHCINVDGMTPTEVWQRDECSRSCVRVRRGDSPAQLPNGVRWSEWPSAITREDRHA